MLANWLANLSPAGGDDEGCSQGVRPLRRCCCCGRLTLVLVVLIFLFPFSCPFLLRCSDENSTRGRRQRGLYLAGRPLLEEDGVRAGGGNVDRHQYERVPESDLIYHRGVGGGLVAGGQDDRLRAAGIGIPRC